MTPKISIIIPAYNASQKIGRCLSSIFRQTFQDFEVIIVNDGSSDDLASALKPWQDRIKLFNQENKGAPAARNFGFSQSMGEYVFFCDADILMKPLMLELLYQTLENNLDCAFAYSSFRFGWKKFRLWPFDYERLKKMPYIPTNSLIRREAFYGFDEKLKKFQDWDLFLTIAERGGKGIWLNKVLYRAIGGGTMSSWLPSFAYKITWLKSKDKSKYEQWKEIVQKKHNLLSS